MINPVFFAVAGWLIVLLTASDVFRSLLVPRASTRFLRLGPIVTAVMLPLWHALADRLRASAARQTMRASLAPLMLVLFLVIWAVLLVLGYGLVFWGNRTGFAPHLDTFADAVYAAGLSFSTLGAPASTISSAARLAVFGCALSGLAIVTVVATFLISIQGGFGRREGLVLRLEAHVSLPPTGITILEAFAHNRVSSRMAPFFDAWEVWSAEVALSHRAFPILLFFRSNDERCEWLAALGAVLNAAALVDAYLADVSADTQAGAHFVLRSGARLLNDLVMQLPVSASSCTGASNDLAAFPSNYARLAEAGFKLCSDPQAADDRFARSRATFEPALAILARYLRVKIAPGCEP